MFVSYQISLYILKIVIDDYSLLFTFAINELEHDNNKYYTKKEHG